MEIAELQHFLDERLRFALAGYGLATDVTAAEFRSLLPHPLTILLGSEPKRPFRPVNDAIDGEPTLLDPLIVSGTPAPPSDRLGFLAKLAQDRFIEVLERHDGETVQLLLDTAVKEVERWLITGTCSWNTLWLAGHLRPDSSIETVTPDVEIVAFEEEVWADAAEHHPDVGIRYRQDDAGEPIVDPFSILDLLQVIHLTPLVPLQLDEPAIPLKGWLSDVDGAAVEAATLRRWAPCWLTHLSIIETSVRSLDRALHSPSPVETIAWTIVALESLLTSGESDGAATSYRVRMRAALLASDEADARKRWFRILKDAYAVRNGIMHGVPRQNLASRVRDLTKSMGSGDATAIASSLLQLWRSLALNVLSRMERGQSIGAILASIDEALLETHIPEADNVVPFPGADA